MVYWLGEHFAEGGAGLLHQVGPKSRNLTPRANNFSSVFDRKPLGHRNYPSVGFIGFKIRQSFTEADRTSEFRLTGHISNMRRSFGLADGTSDQPIGRDPCRVPGFQGLAAYLTLKARDLACRRHGFGPPVNCTAFAGSMARF